MRGCEREGERERERDRKADRKGWREKERDSTMKNDIKLTESVRLAIPGVCICDL